MIIKQASQVPLKPVTKGIGIRWLLAPQDGTPNYAMRIIEIQAGIVFKPHHHPYEHEIYVLSGQGVVTNPQGDVAEMKPGTVLLIQPDEPHGYRNTGDTVLQFICIIPNPK